MACSSGVSRAEPAHTAPGSASMPHSTCSLIGLPTTRGHQPALPFRGSVLYVRPSRALRRLGKPVEGAARTTAA